MKEIEVKILEIDKDKVIRQLKDLGAKKVFDGTLSDSHFDFSDKTLRKEGKLLRIRVKGDKLFLTYKEPVDKSKAKIMEEHEISLQAGHYDKLKSLIIKTGLKEKKQVPKKRISFRLEDVIFEIDTFEGIPPFLEIEAPSIERIKEYVEKLSFSMDDVKPWNTFDVFKYYKKIIP
ncbi:MAG: class IV adenylate cyclase [bacterium]